MAEGSWKEHGLELWGGVEGTVNRVRDEYFSQMDRSGHARRLDDLDRFAALGIRALRYPVLWERTAPNGLGSADWSWPDERLHRLRELGITPVAGLVHHGSGPAHTSLVDPAFADGLARYAGAVAQRYPWLDHYTPVNEPLTTARFSCLYGVWYPHERHERSFRNALLNQCRGVVLSMREIRKVNPAARLVQTDDLGKNFSTPLLAYQAEHNNRLRWLSWDLLCGRVTRHHELWDWLTGDCGASHEEILWFADNPCPPDIIGINYYITSERYLDEDLSVYPERYHGGNGRHAFADIEVARCLATSTGGIAALLREAWERYRLPLAVTEAHIDATREDQMRWLAQSWRAAEAVRAEGADIRAVTVWSLLGAFDWNCLVTRCLGYYEPGPYDVRGPQPRATAVAGLMQELATGRLPEHPVLSGPGWWERDDRYFARPVSLPGQTAVNPMHASGNKAPLLITGASGTLGAAFARLCRQRGLNHRVLRREEMDIADTASTEQALEQYRPWAVINAAGYVRVDEAERDAERCFRENTLGPSLLAAVCARHALPLVTFSTDLVFGGERCEPYLESHGVAPLNVYGRSKAEAEQRVLDLHPSSMVVRTSAFFGPWDEHNYVSCVLRSLGAGQPFAAASDLTVSPTYVPDLVNACLDLLIDKAGGIWHLSSGEALSWAEFARRVTDMAGLDPGLLRPCPSGALGFTAPRPAYSAMTSERALIMPSLEHALARYAHAVLPAA